MRVNDGTDWQAKAMGGDTVLGDTGTSTAVATATLTDSTKSWTTNSWKGHIVHTGGVYGVILSNTATVLTIDMWHTPSAPSTVAANPATGTYGIGPAQAPAWWLGLSVATRTLAAADAFLTNDGTTVSELWAAGGGLNRALAAFTHSAGVGSYTLTKQFTSNSNDNGGAAVAVHRVGVFIAQVTAAPSTTTSGPMAFETNLSTDANLVPTSGDQVTITEAVSI